MFQLLCPQPASSAVPFKPLPATAPPHLAPLCCLVPCPAQPRPPPRCWYKALMLQWPLDLSVLALTLPNSLLTPVTAPCCCVRARCATTSSLGWHACLCNIIVPQEGLQSWLASVSMTADAHPGRPNLPFFKPSQPCHPKCPARADMHVLEPPGCLRRGLQSWPCSWTSASTPTPSSAPPPTS